MIRPKAPSTETLAAEIAQAQPAVLGLREVATRREIGSRKPTTRFRTTLPGRALAATIVLAALAMTTAGIALASRSGAVPKALVGCWTRHSATRVVLIPAGTWQLAITPNGRIAAFIPDTGGAGCQGAAHIRAGITVVGTNMTIKPTLPVCANPARYSWKVSGKSLTIKTVADDCTDRTEVFSHVWTRK
jgi:hypothetical protein